MAVVDLKPGDSLNLIWKSVQDTPLGRQEMESSFTFTYDELLQRLQGKQTGAKSKKSVTEGARFSRMVALTCNAIRKGKWSTGAEIDRSVVIRRLHRRFDKLAPEEYHNVTENARAALKEILGFDGKVRQSEMGLIRQMEAAIGQATGNQHEELPRQVY